MAQRNTTQALDWLEGQRTRRSQNWRAMCLKLARSARSIPAVHPSAFAAMHATPMSDRVTDRSKIQPGMVAYFDDPNDSNRWGHIATVGWNTGTTWTNDALRSGEVDLVGIGWFKDHWGDDFKFAARSVNGFQLILPNPEPSKSAPLPERVTPAQAKEFWDYADHRLVKAIRWHEANGQKDIGKALRVEVRQLRVLRKKAGI